MVELALRTHCPYCAYQCGIRMSDAAEAILGDPHFPVNNGQLCIKGWSAGALLRHPQRLTTPLVRDSRKDDFRPADWDEALDRIADAMRRTREQYGPDANAMFGSGALTNEKVYLLGKFARLALGTANIDYNGRYCMSSAAGGNNRAFGVDRGMPFPVNDIGEAELIVLIGSNCADTLPPIMQWFQKQKANGGRVIVIDPRRTSTARSADLHLQTTPGTDLALANGLLYLAIELDLLNREYITTRTNGFDAVRATVLNDHPARTERITGVGEPLLRQAIKWMSAAKSCMFLTGRGAEQHSKGVDTVNAWTNLALALGLPGKPQSGYGTLTGQGNGQGGREHGQKADQLPGYRLIENPDHREAMAKFWGVPAESLPRKGKSAYELIDALGESPGTAVPGLSPIRTLFVMGSNLVVASPDVNRTVARLKATDFLAVADSFLNETSQIADVVLPVYQWAEENGTMTNFEGRVIRRRQTALAPTGVRGDLDILRELADRLGCGDKFAFNSAREVFDEFRRATAGGTADYSGITYEKIEANEGVFWPCPAEDHPGTPRLFADRFFHPDGKAKFLPVEHRPAGDTPDAAFPYLFTTGRYKEHYNSGVQTRQVGELTKAKPGPLLQVHPTLARRHGIAGGNLVTLESRRGRAEFRVDVTPDIRPDTLFAPFHWGGREGANLLIGGFLDPVSRMPEFKLAAVRVVSVSKSAP
ncbi:molybdopterin oxidoreductase family protein [Limnoglobus roseus]|uniref:Nitrite reductase n=1 Tax=Limnoglobus roseus TaxID=2598579 RepID=A0A5C1A8M7_9BACT|nr:molybdopterin oxidoreductase family protein [Limnoglobus roseus]QEL13504.1 nitrite reductase [Limnoglobus roseus]